MSRRYSLFGLILESDIRLDELEEDSTTRPADVRVRVGSIEQDLLLEPGLHRLGTQDDFLQVADVGRYRVRGGKDVLVEAVPGAPHQNVTLYLLGSVMGLLLHQRGGLPLHGNAIEIDGVGWVFLGPSGAGKSTLAAWFHDRGMRIIADDVAVVGTVPTPIVHPGVPRLRLWKDAAEHSGRSIEALRYSYAGDQSWEKFDVPLKNVEQRAAPLTGICLLERGTDERLQKLPAMASVDRLMANTYRGAYLRDAEARKRHWDACIDLVRQIPVFEWTRRWSLDDFDRSATALLASIRRITLPADAG